VGRIGSGVRVSASCQLFALSTLLHSAEGYLRGGVIFSRGDFPGGGNFMECFRVDKSKK